MIANAKQVDGKLRIANADGKCFETGPEAVLRAYDNLDEIAAALAVFGTVTVRDTMQLPNVVATFYVRK